VYVQSKDKTLNFSEKRDIKVDLTGNNIQKNVQKSLIKFDTSCVVGPVEKVTLSLFVTNESKEGGMIYWTQNNWSDNSVTWNTAPAIIGNGIKQIGRVKSGELVQIDLPVNALTRSNDSVISFMIKPLDDNGAYYYSTRSIEPPTLHVTFSGIVSKKGCTNVEVSSARKYKPSNLYSSIYESSGD